MSGTKENTDKLVTNMFITFNRQLGSRTKTVQSYSLCQRMLAKRDKCPVTLREGGAVHVRALAGDEINRDLLR